MNNDLRCNFSAQKLVLHFVLSCFLPSYQCYSDPKPGTCPATDGAIGTCVEECLQDADCDGGHKCCSNGCGHVCVEPEPSKN